MPIFQLAELRNQKILMDFTVKIKDHIFAVHKLVLAAHSEYFKAMFTSEWLENVKNELILDDVNPETFKRVLKYCYAWDIQLMIADENKEAIVESDDDNTAQDTGGDASEDNGKTTAKDAGKDSSKDAGEQTVHDLIEYVGDDDIVDLLSLSSRLQMQNLMELCATFACENITTLNCIPLLYQADCNNLEDLRDSTIQFCCDSFQDIVKTEAFAACDYTLLQQIIQKDDLAVLDESEVYESILKWVSIDPKYREAQLHHLLEHVRLVHMEPSYLIKISDQEIIKKSEECVKQVDNSKSYLILADKPGRDLHFKPLLSLDPRISLPKMYVFGGVMQKEGKKVSVESYEIYDLRSSTSHCYTYPSELAGRYDCGVTSIGNLIYFIGGLKGHSLCKTNLIFNCKTRRWSSDIATMPVMRYGIRAIAHNGLIYTLGGYDDSDVHGKELSCYDPKQNVWSTIFTADHSLGQKAAVLSNNGCIYIIGGIYSGAASDRVCEYDISQKKWNTLPNLNRKRKDCGACVCKKRIYVIGGNDDKDAINSVEVYDETQGRWDLTTPLNGGYMQVKAAVFDDKIYAIGERYEGNNSVEVYDPDTKKWSESMPLKTARKKLGLVVV